MRGSSCFEKGFLDGIIIAFLIWVGLELRNCLEFNSYGFINRCNVQPLPLRVSSPREKKCDEVSLLWT